MPIATRATRPTPTRPLRAISPGARRPWRPRRPRHYFVATGLWRIAGLGRACAPALAESRPHRLAGSAAGANRRRSAAGAKTALPCFLSGRFGHSQSRAIIRAPRCRCLRRDLRPLAGARSCRPRCASCKPPAVVGTYRLLRQTLAEEYGGFYTAGEFDIGDLIARHGNLQFLELGRSCVLAPYRNKRPVELLVRHLRLHRSEPHRCHDRLRQPRRHRAPATRDAPVVPASLCMRAGAMARAGAARRYVEMNRMSKEAIDPKAALRALPPLLKGYLRLGAFVGDGAVVDYEFGTTDVLIVLPYRR